MFDDTDPWERWFGRVISLIETYDIDMWSYINCDWDSQPMWKGVGFGDTRLSINSNVMKKWHHYVIEGRGNQTFLMGDALDCDYTSKPDPTRLEVSGEFHRYTFGDTLQLSFIVFCSFILFFAVRQLFLSTQKRSKKVTPTERQAIFGAQVSYYQT